jgi:hypothetical protein
MQSPFETLTSFAPQGEVILKDNLVLRRPLPSAAVSKDGN